MTARIVPDDEAGRALAINVLCRGGLVAMPTDTVYGLGVTLEAENGLERLFAAKNRPLDKAIVLLLAEATQAEEVGVMSPMARTLAERFWPGGLTLVLPQQPGSALPDVLTAGQSTIGVRMPNHDCPRSLAREFGPLPVTSANISGQPPATTAQEVFARLGERIDLILDGGPARGGVPSTVVDCSGEEPRVLREGAIETRELVAEVRYPYGAAAVRLAGMNETIAAAARYKRELARRTAELGRPLEIDDELDETDFWAALLGGELGLDDPELGWEYVCRLVDEVMTDPSVLSLVGASELEDFCWEAAAVYIDRIEERARTNEAFRAALGVVWPGQGRIPPEIYARIRSAAGF